MIESYGILEMAPDGDEFTPDRTVFIGAAEHGSEFANDRRFSDMPISATVDQIHGLPEVIVIRQNDNGDSEESESEEPKAS